MTAFWNHKRASSAGVGILIKNEFLARFQDSSCWHKIEDGHLARLALSGMDGSLDIWCLYLPTGEQPSADKSNREQLIKNIATNCEHPHRTLTILCGDWNFAQNGADRMCLQNGTLTGNKDKAEATHCQKTLLDPFGFHELTQDSFTYYHTIALSKIDRIYSNHHAVTQLDSNYHCSVLKHHTNLSKHCPVSFGRKYTTKNYTSLKEDINTNTNLPPIKPETIKHEDWQLRVSAEYYHQLQQDPLAHNAVRRMIILKKAIRTVSEHIQSEQHNTIHTNERSQEQDKQQQLNHTMGCIRAAKQSNIYSMQHHTNRYTKIQDYINPTDPLAYSRPTFFQLEDHAVALAREIFTAEAQELQHSQLLPDDPIHIHKKQNLLTKLKRLYPGSTSGIGAMEDHEGNVHTDADSITKTLTEHWSQTFKATAIDHTLLTKWLDKVSERTIDTNHSNDNHDQPYTKNTSTHNDGNQNQQEANAPKKHHNTTQQAHAQQNNTSTSTSTNTTQQAQARAQAQAPTQQAQAQAQKPHHNTTQQAHKTKHNLTNQQTQSATLDHSGPHSTPKQCTLTI
jgi:hypothetical protein